MNVQSIVHPTDSSDLGVDAFVHALRVALGGLRTIARSPIRSWQIDAVEVVTVAGRQAFLPGAQALRIKAKQT
jgi:hypothetical protein